MEYSIFNSLLSEFSNSNLQISICDLSGITSFDNFKIQSKYNYHLNDFCRLAKSTKYGFKRCEFCKLLSNTKAITTKKRFSGYCANGLYEIAQPIIFSGKVIAILYVGNICFDKKVMLKRLSDSCSKTNVNLNDFDGPLKQIEYTDNIALYELKMDILEEYFNLLLNKYPPQFSSKQSDNHWGVSMLKNYADQCYNQELNLESLASSHYINEKYLGRLFKKQIGISFHEYLTNVRLAKAYELIIKSQKKIIDISEECGFQNISYFNRMFSKKYSATPSFVRKKYIE